MKSATWGSDQTTMGYGVEKALTIVSGDGTPLDAVVSTPAVPRGSMLLAHGFGADYHEEGAFDRLAVELVTAGFAVVRFSFRGHGRSGGEETEMTIAGERLDLAAAYQWMVANLPGPFGLLGASFGAVSTVLELGSLNPKPTCVALWNPALEISEVFGPDLVRQTREHGYAQVNGTFRVGQSFAEERSRHHGNLGLHHLGAVPALIVHGTNDVQVPLASSVAAATAPMVELVVLRGARHGFHEPRWEREAIQVTVNWVERHLQSDSLWQRPEEPVRPEEGIRAERRQVNWTEYRSVQWPSHHSD